MNDTFTIEYIRDRWWWVLVAVRRRSPTTEALLRAGRLEALEDGAIILSWPFAFHRDALNEPERHDLVQSAVDEVIGKQYSLRFTMNLAQPCPAPDDTA